MEGREIPPHLDLVKQRRERVYEPKLRKVHAQHETYPDRPRCGHIPNDTTLMAKGPDDEVTCGRCLRLLTGEAEQVHL